MHIYQKKKLHTGTDLKTVNAIIGLNAVLTCNIEYSAGNVAI